MRVLHVINSFKIRGAEVLLFNFLINSKNEQMLQNDVCVLYDEKTYLYDKIIEHGVNVFNLGFKRKYNIAVIFKLVKVIRDGQYDLVHVHLFPSLYFCAVASLFTQKTKYIFTEHSIFNRRRNYWIFRITDFLSYKVYRQIICVSKMAKDNLNNWIPNIKQKLTVIYNGVPLAEDICKQDIVYDLLLIGSMNSNVKGIDVFLKAIKNIESHINKVVIAGDGNLKNELVELRDTLGLQTKVEFLGNRNDINNLLDKSRIFVLPSRWEGLPISILEAMARAKPIISTNVGGIPEAISDGKTGLLVTPEDEVELSNAIIKLLNDVTFANQIGKNAYSEVILKFSISNYKSNLLKLYQSLA